MDLKIPDSWLRDYIKTKASPEKLAECLSLCGPSVERIKKIGQDYLYEIEVTTNRVDSASVYGIAREASAILPRFGIAAKLKHIPSQSKNFSFVKNTPYLKPQVDRDLCPRFTAVLIKNVKLGPSPKWVCERLASSGVRPINNVVDISNYIMLLLGQPVHTFDYDKILGAKMILRKSIKGEKITTLDKKRFTLPGGDIVIEDGKGRLIDLAGVMGGDLSAVDENTKNVLLFVQTYNPVNIRRTSMSLAQRTQAATIFEKGTDPENVAPAILMGIELFEKLTGGKAQKDILDIYPNPYKPKSIATDLRTINKGLGTEISKSSVTSYLNSLGIECKWRGLDLQASVPSYRSRDILIPEDILEEVARIYGYHNLPSVLMSGQIPIDDNAPRFRFERDIKNYLSGWGGVEVYTLSLVPKQYAAENALGLVNPLGVDSEFLRTSMMPSLIDAAKINKGTVSSYHIFEMANIYIPRKNNLPDERLILAGIFENHDYRGAKGVVEALLSKLNIDPQFTAVESNGFAPGRCLEISFEDGILGKFGYTENENFIYYEFEVDLLWEHAKPFVPFREFPKFPPQIEDITLILPKRTKVGEVLNQILSAGSRVSHAELTDIYNDAFTFRIWYQDPKKTLTNDEVEKIRAVILRVLKAKLGASLKN